MYRVPQRHSLQRAKDLHASRQDKQKASTNVGRSDDNSPFFDDSQRQPEAASAIDQGFVPFLLGWSLSFSDHAENPMTSAFSSRPEVTVPQDTRGAPPMRKRNSPSSSNIGQQELIDEISAFSDDLDSQNDVHYSSASDLDISYRTHDKHSSAHGMQGADTVIGKEAVQSNTDITETGSPERASKESRKESNKNKSQKDQKWLKLPYALSVVFNRPWPRFPGWQDESLPSMSPSLGPLRRRPTIHAEYLRHIRDQASNEPKSRHFEASATSPDGPIRVTLPDVETIGWFNGVEAEGGSKGNKPESASATTFGGTGRYGSTTLMQAVGSRQNLPHSTKLDSEVAHAVNVPPPTPNRESDVTKPTASAAAPKGRPDDCDDEDVQPATDINLNDDAHSRHYVEHIEFPSHIPGPVVIENLCQYIATRGAAGFDRRSKHDRRERSTSPGSGYWNRSNDHYPRARGLSVSSASSYANSVLSTASLASFATDMSKHSGYSAIQIAVATKELISILSNDEVLAPLYQRAIHDDSIGPEKLERNLRRLVRNYGKHLGQDPGDTLELLASRLVQTKAKEVARSIVQKYNPMTLAMKVVDTNPKQEMSSSEEETDDRDVDESIFQDLALLREFLTSREPFEALRSHIRSFVIQKSERTAITPPPMEKALPFDAVSENLPNTVEEAPATSNPSSSLCAAIGTVKETTKDLFVAVGLLNPPIMPGFSRLSWKCKCGISLFGDVFEYREGGIARLVDRMQRSLGAEIQVSSHEVNKSFSLEQVFRTPRWIRSTTQTLSSAFRASKNTSPCLPQHQAHDTAAVCSPNGNSPASQQTLHFMACMQKGRYHRAVKNHRIDDITTDQELFCFLRRKLSKRRNHIRRFFSLKCIQGLYFVKFRLWAGGSAEIREHEPCCTYSPTKECECIPPVAKVEPAPDAEYRCKPAGPLDVWPPILSQQLMHMLTSPDCIPADETLVLEQLPKRTCGELQGKVRQPAEGWGIHFQEGWDTDILIGVVTIMFLASLVFAIIWSYFKHDIQGAFGVSSYMITAVGVLVALIVNRAGRLG